MYEKSAFYYDVIYSFKNYEKEADKIHQLIQHHKRSPGNNLLDVARGTGNHLAFLRKHYDVEGLDVNPDMLKIARQKHPDLTFHQADMTSFSLNRKFDAIICLFSAIGYVRTKHQLHQTLQNMAHHLQPGGVLIIEPWLSPEVFRPGSVHGLWVDKPDLKIARMNNHIVKDKLSIMDMHHLVGTPKGIEHFVERHEMALFTHVEYLEAFRAANLEVIHDPEGLMGRGLYVATQ